MSTIDEQFFDLALPKWPQMIVRGKAVTVEQAKEIILCTDDTLTSGYGWSYNNSTFFVKFRVSAGFKESGDDWSLSEHIKSRIGCIETAYISNDYAISSFIGGPHGWCNPNGTIHFTDNVGKWPSVKELYDDWVIIAERFPFLHLDATMYSGESCESDTYPICTFSVRGTTVTVGKPVIYIDEELYASSDITLKPIGGQLGATLGLPKEWYLEYATKIKVYADEYKEMVSGST